MDHYGLNGKVAIITGTNNPWGIGAATALAFARNNITVSLGTLRKPGGPFASFLNKKHHPTGWCLFMASCTDLDIVYDLYNYRFPSKRN